MRSRTGCLTCRQRKLKCDEVTPTCGRCRKASRECVPSWGIAFRHQHNPSLNGEDHPDEDALRSFYGYRDTFDADTVWVDVPKQENYTFLNTSNPYLEDFETLSTSSADSPTASAEVNSSESARTFSSSQARRRVSGPHLQPVSSVGPAVVYSAVDSRQATSEKEAVTLSPIILSASMRAPQTVSQSPQGFPSSLGGRAAASPHVGPRLPSLIDMPYDDTSQWEPSPPGLVASIDSFDPLVERDHELAFLMRWFSEGPGCWMDLFDLGKYFASYVPVRARENPLLRYAAAAYSAKSLSRLHGRKPIAGGNATGASLTEVYPDSYQIDWSHKATHYYDRAVSLLLRALQEDSNSSPPSEPKGEPAHPRSGHVSQLEQQSLIHRPRRSAADFKSDTDELLAASAILSVYEFLDASVPEWEKHLNGAKSLLVVAKERIEALQYLTHEASTTSAESGLISKARRATFWNIARQDMLAAFINNTHTQLDTEDLSLWKEAGLLIDENGFILPSNTTESGYPEGEHMMKEDLICNALVWLMAKLVNFMAAGDELPAEMGGGTGVAGLPQRTLLDYWYILKQQFQTWYEGLPVTFQPCARLDPSHLPNHALREDVDVAFPEVWYSIPMCASTMQCYHMSQIQLLMNKPHESTQGRTTVSARLRSYQAVLAACQTHSREIVGISLARPEDAVRIHSTQPLFTAGQCLSDLRERQVVLKLLRDVETDIGWATGYRVRQLLQQWESEEQGEVPVL